MNKILYGDVVKQEWLEEMKKDLNTFKELYRIKTNPVLTVIQVGDNQASNKYISNKIKACSTVGVDVKHIHFDKDTPEKVIINNIRLLNKNNRVDGIIVQLPLPPHIDAVKIGEAIIPSKDVDGFTSVNVGRTLLGEDSMVSCTPQGIMKIFDYYNIDLKGKNVVVIGRSNIVGKPMSSLLINAGATVTVCNSLTKDITKYTYNADIVITAVGKAKIFNSVHFLHGQVLVDVGINFDENGKLCGDIDKEDVLNTLTNVKLVPSPRGCGQTTVAALVNNTLKSYYNYFKNR